MQARSSTIPDRRHRALLTFLVAAVLVLTQSLVTPARAAVVDTNRWYVLVNVHSGKALDVYETSTANGARIGQWTRNDGDWQQWRFLDSGGGDYRLQSRHSGKVVDVSGRSTADGADVVQWTDNNATNQRFRLADSSDGSVRLINRHSGKALEVWEWSTADGARVSQFADTDGANQRWRLVPVGSTGGANYPNPGAVTGHTGLHDPEVVKTPDGGYLLASTGPGVPLKTSTNRTHWTDAGSAFPGGTPWADTYTGGSAHLWAPEIHYANNQYYLWYSASTFHSNRSAIFLATSPTGAAGSWTHRGLVIESNSANNFNAIDPALVVDEQGAWWMSFGSHWSGIKMIRLDPSTGMRSGTAFHSLASRGGDAVEAPTIHRANGYYYLYTSFDKCCEGTDSTYRIMVGRSTSVTGPYVDRAGVPLMNGGGTEILASHGSIHGPGHQTVFSDTDADVLMYHHYTGPNSSVLGINLLGYDGAGWPYVY
ncbi:RICIN domain-containing protein [Isoptericola croceus]|uniref:RICIN domain-containing protein n=1 Tax=Isoptericola croceus TaxID=3031406 RepID=UPI0023F7D3A4|nr:RICIN domain-containing protein [Isoptericola croceus]